MRFLMNKESNSVVALCVLLSGNSREGVDRVSYGLGYNS